MPTTSPTASAPYDLSQTEEDIAALQGAISNMEEINYFLLTSPQPPNTLSDRVQLFADISQQLPAYVNPTGFNGVIPCTNVVWQPGNTVTQAALNNLASQQIPANDAVTNSLYEVEVWGNGTWGSTAQTLQLAVNLAGSAATSLTLGSSVFSASQAFRFRVTCRVMCNTANGASTTWNSLLFGEITESGNNILPTGGTQNSVPFCACESTGTITQSNLVSNQFGLLAAWGSTTGAPTLTSRWARFSKIF